MDRAKINKPLLVVLGTTGVGKSQLGIELARAVDGEVINADSMQVYKGLDIVTNKATMQERQGVPHHLMDFLDPSKEYSVSDFDRDASRAISDIHSRGKVPILVGGTNYYIQSLLWREQTITKAKAEQERLLAEEEDSAIHSSVVDHPLAGKMTEALTATNPRVYSPSEIGVYLAGANLWDLLKEVDPVMADRWHERHGRKIRRSIQVFYTTGRKHSELIAEQWRQKTSSGSALRHDTCVFWLHAPPAILNPRLDARVDQMIERGLFQELSEMRADVRRGDVIGAPQDASIPTINYTRGILQAIGFKEFDHYLTLMDGKASGSEAQPQPEEIAKARAQGLEDMKCATRQYARKQVSWIKNKLAISCLNDAERPSAKDAHSMCFFLLDASPLSDWTATVAAKAIGLTKSKRC
ncbi:hypothetical protein HKX48_005492 [Thoreauomyces humboldtii]|nr:hypothetical protein HKX48_005492 [Thoreauomyces humboldtii]